MKLTDASLGLKLNIALLTFVLLLGLASSAIILYGFSRTQDNATERSREALEQQGQLALQALAGGVTDAGVIQFESSGAIGQRASRYLQDYKASNGTPAYDTSRLVRLENGVAYDPDPTRTSDVVVVNNGELAGGVLDDIAYTAALDSLYAALIEPYPGEFAGDAYRPIAMTFLGVNGVGRIYPPIGVHETTQAEVDVAALETELGPLANPGRETVWTVPYEDLQGRGLVMTAVTPVYDGDAFRGIFEVDLSIARLVDLVNALKPTETGFTFYVDKEGAILQTSAFDLLSREVESNAQLADILHEMSTPVEGREIAVEEVTLEGREYFIAYNPMLVPGGSLAVAAPVDELTDQAAQITAGIEEEGNRTFLIMLGAMATLFVVGLIAATYLNRRVIVGPIRRLADATQAVATGDLNTRVDLDRHDELGTLGDSFNTMVDQLRESERLLERRVEERTLELAALLEVSRAVASSLDPAEVLGTILDQLGTIIEHTGSSILLLKDDALEFVEARTVAANRAQIGARIPLDAGSILWDAVSAGESVLIDDVRADEPQAEGFRAAVSSIGDLSKPPFSLVRSWMAVPLALKDRTLGALTISWTEPSYFTADHARLARAFADQAAIAIENARLFDETQTRGRETEALFRADAELFRSLDLDTVLQALVDVTVDVIEVDKSMVATWDQDAGVMSLRATRNLNDKSLAYMHDLFSQRTQSMESPTVMITADPSRAQPHLVPIIESEGIRSMIEIPVVSLDGRPLGFFSVAYTNEHHFAEAEQRLLRALADRAAIAIDNARQLDETERRARETEALFRADAELFQSLDLDSVLQAVVGVTVDIIGADMSMVATWSATEPLRLCTAPQQSPEHLAEVMAAIESLRSERERVLGTGVIIMEGIESAHPLLKPIWEREGIHAVMEVPIKSPRGTLLGAFTVTYLTPHTFSPEEQRLLKALAERAAVAIENAELYQRAQLAASLEERQRLARELHDSVSQALYGIALGARTARTLLDRDPAAAAEPVDYVLSLAEAGMAEMRALIFELRPESLETEGLVAAIGKQLDALQARHGIEVTRSLGEEPDLPLSTKEALYRIAQESLTNTAKHSKATSVSVTLSRADGVHELTLSDNGTGFDPEGDFPGHLGLRSMTERCEKCGGTLLIDSTPGSGTRITAKVPASSGD